MEERKREREDIEDYRAMLDELLPKLTRANYKCALELTQLAEKLRGFGHVKQANIERRQQRRERLQRGLSGRDLAVELFSP